MIAVKRIGPCVLYGIASLICSVSTVAAVMALLLKEASQREIEPGLFDLPPSEFILFVLICPVIHVAGLFLGAVSFWLQPNTNGIGLWAMIVSLLLLLFDFLVWLQWTN
jgi:hypothetical protein